MVLIGRQFGKLPHELRRMPAGEWERLKAVLGIEAERFSLYAGMDADEELFESEEDLLE